MPNWSEAVLKIRGKKENIENFIRNGICYEEEKILFENGNMVFEKDGSVAVEIIKRKDIEIEIDEDGIEISNTMDLWVKNTRRMFINSKSIECYYSGNKEKEIIVIDIRQAWFVDAEQLLKISKEYDLDFKVNATECGMEFCQEIEIVNKEIIKNDEITFDNFMWECYDPRIGG